MQLTIEDIVFLQENLRYAKQSYEEKSGQYRFGPQKIDKYYENYYVPQMEKFQKMAAKLSAMAKELK